jgi:putative two-component system response regulator
VNAEVPPALRKGLPPVTKKLILAVDDEPIMLEVLREQLSGDYEVICVTNGPEAIEAARNHQPSLILLDIQMPGMDGFTVCTLLKENPDTSRIPVIFVTAYGQADAAEQGIASGAVDYVVKPFMPTTLHERIRAHLPPTEA